MPCWSVPSGLTTYKNTGPRSSSTIHVAPDGLTPIYPVSIICNSAGMIWKLGAANGERLGTGDMAPDIVDCNAPFLLAAIPQDRFSDVEVGGLAQFRLSLRPAVRLSGSHARHVRGLFFRNPPGLLSGALPAGAPIAARSTISMPRVIFALGKRLMR
ncbi:MAG: hypothetical protein USCAAHI_00357 [Beijerinckiaceae bacterium]|nr:MAG: hypothetical protein USCAAHI_00357 [Beijerinckiaceae bacterium]